MRLNHKIISASILGIQLLILVIIWKGYYETNTKFAKFVQSQINQNLPKIHLIECSDRDTFTFKQLCVIESTSKHHPNHMIHVWTVSRKLQYVPKLVLIQKKYPNIDLVNIDVKNFIENSQLKNIWNKLQMSQFYVPHLSDVLRVLILEEVGGIYLDLDALVIRPLPHDENFIGLNEIGINNYELNNGVMKFQTNNLILQEIIFGLSKYFDGDYYAGNGPQLITKVVKDVCEGKYENCDFLCTDVKATCLNLTIYDNWVFHPIPYFNWEKLYEETTSFDFSLLHKSSYTVHLWNKLSFPIERAPKSSAIRKLVEENCPNVNDIMLNFCQISPPLCLPYTKGKLLCESLLNCRLM